MTQTVVIRYLGRKTVDDGLGDIKTISTPTVEGVHVLDGITTGQLAQVDQTTLSHGARVIVQTALNVDAWLNRMDRPRIVVATDQKLVSLRPKPEDGGWYYINTSPKLVVGRAKVGLYEFLMWDVSISKTQRRRTRLGSLNTLCQEVRDAAESFQPSGNPVDLLVLSVALKPTPYERKDKVTTEARRNDIMEILRAATNGHGDGAQIRVRDIRDTLNRDYGRNVEMGTVISDLHAMQREGMVELRPGSIVVVQEAIHGHTAS